MTFMAIVGLHAVVIAALITARFIPPLIDNGPKPFDVINDPPEVIPPPSKPIPKPVKLDRFEVPVPVIDLPIPVSEEALVVDVGPPQETATGPAQVDAGSGTATVITALPSRVFTDLQYRAVRSPDDYYPPTSVSLQERGVAIVRLCVDGAGRLQGTPTIQASSGFKRLDQAALKWVREALRFTPATENGVGVSSCKGFRVVFNLN